VIAFKEKYDKVFISLFQLLPSMWKLRQHLLAHKIGSASKSADCLDHQVGTEIAICLGPNLDIYLESNP
jgi:hypothetical protein